MGVSVLELVEPIYFLPIGAFLLVILGCACYGCYDLFNPNQQDVMIEGMGRVVACDISDCPIPDIHEQHKMMDDKPPGFWSKRAWGLVDSPEPSTANPAPGDCSAIMMIPPLHYGYLNISDSSAQAAAGYGGSGDLGGGADCGGCD